MTIALTADDKRPVPHPIIVRVLCDEPECCSEDEFEFREAGLIPPMAEARRIAKSDGWREYPPVGRDAPTHRCPVCSARRLLGDDAPRHDPLPGQLDMLEER